MNEQAARSNRPGNRLEVLAAETFVGAGLRFTTADHETWCALEELGLLPTSPPVFWSDFGLGYLVTNPCEIVAPGSPDFVFPGEPKTALFVNGCWWHGCPFHWKAPGCGSRNKVRLRWEEKIETNRRRDRRVARELRGLGWSVLTLWEHDFKSALRTRLPRILELLKERQRCRRK